MQKAIVVTIDRFEGDFAVLLHKDHEILWPTEDLPPYSKEGDVITLTAVSEQEEKKDRVETAKQILNDILNDTLKAPGTRPRTQEEHETLEEDRLQTIDTDLRQIDKDIKKGNENRS